MKQVKEFLDGGAPDPSSAAVTLIQVPFEKTTGWIRGTASGPQAIIEASAELDDFGTETGKDISTLIHTVQNPLNGSPEKITSELEEIFTYTLKNRSIPFVLGGEHTVTFFSANAFQRMGKTPGGVLVFDAHPDALHEYRGHRISHASVTRLIRETFPSTPIFVAGIRVFTEEEFSFFKTREIHFWSPLSPCRIHEAISESIKLLNSPVFVSIDLDVLDMAFLPSVSNPVPGGLSPNEVKMWLKRILIHFDAIYVDIVEFSPPSGERPSLLPAELVKFCAEIIAQKSL